ncbi:MAG TPA: Tim44-like domain-containing protein [Casimicrobiaceae bacterium]|nr:Tim44-like domain-containing protein [Casimicrobiaceae bacterium]
MNRLFVIALAAAASFALVHADFADAARIGGGRSFGMQRSIAPPAPRTAPSNPAFAGPAERPVMPATPGAAATRTAPGAAAAANTASRGSRWLGPIAGLAAGLGLAALFSHFGLSEGLGSLLLIGLLVVAAIALVRAFAARRAASPYQYAGTPDPRDAFERPQAPAADTAWGSPPGVSASAGKYPPGFDPLPFIAQAKQQFRRLQAAYDRGDRALLADVTTREMNVEIARDLDGRGPQIPTEVVTLDADVAEVVQEGDRYVATVRFHGTLREDGNPAVQPFEEMWHLVKPVDGSSGWLLAGIQQYAAH